MPNTKALERRIRKHITSQEHTFFVVAGPGLEDLCREEIADRLPGADIDPPTEGGIGFRARIHDAYAVNLWSRTASRVLMRIGGFTADGFGQLKRKVKAFPWELYIPQTARLHVNAALHRSRLYHRDAVAERIRDGIESRLAADGIHLETTPSDSGPTTTLYARAVSDRFVLSLDMSGDHLHKRGLKTRGGEAPLRETLAAAVLKLAGYQPGAPLIDPMCGSGTFSLEAAMMARHIPPGWYRRFAFQTWPGFQPGRWRHLRREAERGMRVVETAAIFASDRRAAMVGALKETLRSAGMENVVRVKRKDFFELTIDATNRPGGLLVLNPPYGRRLAAPDDSRKLYREIGRKIRRDFKGWRFAVLSPAAGLDEQLRLKGRRLPLFHGGLDLILIIGDIR